MDIQKEREALIAELEQFKREALKSHIVKVWAETYKNDPFGYLVKENGSILWSSIQAFQLWRFWQAAKAQAAEKIEALQNAVIFADECRKEWHESYMKLRKDKAMPEGFVLIPLHERETELSEVIKNHRKPIHYAHKL